jgi:uncharacterized OB-fold protein
MAESRPPQKSLPKINPVDKPFWDAAAAGKLLLQRCTACGKIQFFPRVACVDCFADLEWVEVAGAGKVHTFTLVRVPRNPAFKDEAPIYYVNIILDEGVIIESRLVGESRTRVKTGDRVKVVFQATQDPQIKLPVFELAG